MSSIWDFIGPDGRWINPVDDDVIDGSTTANRADLNDAADNDGYASLPPQSPTPSNYWAARSLLDRFPASFERDEVVAPPALPMNPNEMLGAAKYLGWEGAKLILPHLAAWESAPKYPAFTATPGKVPNVDTDPRLVGILPDLANITATLAPMTIAGGPLASVTRSAVAPLVRWIESRAPTLAQYVAKSSGPIVGDMTRAMPVQPVNTYNAAKAAKDPMLTGRHVERKYWELVNPPDMPPRPFNADYKYPPKADAEGRLSNDIEGRPLGAKYIVGRKTVGGLDQGLSRADYDAINRELFRTRPSAVGNVRDVELTPTVLRDGTDTYRVRVNKTYSPAEQDMLVARGTARGINIKAEFPYSELNEHEARRVFDDLNNRPQITLRAENPEPAKISTFLKWGPEQSGYNSREKTYALQDEAMRAYAANPNYAKTVMPDQAAMIRNWINTHPTISKIIQFNSVATMLGVPTIAEWPQISEPSINRLELGNQTED